MFPSSFHGRRSRKPPILHSANQLGHFWPLRGVSKQVFSILASFTTDLGQNTNLREIFLYRASGC